MTNIIPYGSRILVQRIPEEQKTSGGIIIPGAEHKKSSQFGTVLAIGNEQDDIEPGEVVFFSKYSGIEIDETHLILEEKDVLAFVKKEDIQDLLGGD